MKRILSLFLVFTLLCAAAFAEAGFTADLGNDGTLEEFGVNNVLIDENNWNNYNLDLTVSRDGVLQDTMNLTSYTLPANFRVRVLRMTSDLIFIETRICVDNVATKYMVVGFDGSKLVKYMDIEDLGTSVGVEIKDNVTGEDAFSSVTYDESEVLAALENAFAIYGLTFQTGEYAFNDGMMQCATVNLPETSLLMDVSNADVIGSVLATEGTAELETPEQETAETVEFTPVEEPDEITAIEPSESADSEEVLPKTYESSGTTASGDTSSSSKKYAIATGNVNVRKNAGTSYGKLGTLSTGTCVTFKGTIQEDNKGNKWYKIDYKGSTGWISAGYAKLSDTKPSASSEEKKSESKTKSSDKKYVVTTGNVNVRKEADKDSKSLGTVANNKTLDFKGTIKTDSRGVDWYKVSYNGSTGWVSSQYGKLTNTKAGGSDSKERTSSKKYVVTTGSVNIRSSADKTSGDMGTVKKGTTLTFKGVIRTDDRGVDWYKVSYNGKYGWVSSKYSKLTNTKGGSSSEEEKSGEYVKTTGKVNLRKEADKTSKSLAVIPSGKKLTYKGSSKKDDRGVRWYKVSYDGKTGWVSEKYSKLVK